MPEEALHVTNGDSAAMGVRAAGVGGEVLPWRDVLHAGPVPAGLDPDRLRQVRASFLEGQGWARPDEATADLEARDRTLAAQLTAGGAQPANSTER